jgi:hypothetical protein
MKINEKGNVEFDPVEVFKSLPEESQKKLAKSLACDDFYIRKVVDLLCGEDEDGWFTGIDADYRQEILERIEKSHTKNPFNYSWSVWKEILQTVKSLKSEQHLYYKLYHHQNQDLTIRQFMDNIKDEDSQEYFTTKADKEIEEIKTIIKEKLTKEK